MLDEIYVCAIYLPPPQTRNEEVTVWVKHPDNDGIDYMPGIRVPRLKHMSINKIDIGMKRFKKQKEIRHFFKPTSVFARWKE